MNREEISLKPGDCVYYRPHHALGFLIGKEPILFNSTESNWRIALRSPRNLSEPNVIIVSFRCESQEKLIKAINEGRLEYYEKQEKIL